LEQLLLTTIILFMGDIEAGLRRQVQQHEARIEMLEDTIAALLNSFKVDIYLHMLDYTPLCRRSGVSNVINL
jgi:hypothetical protein